MLLKQEKMVYLLGDHILLCIYTRVCEPVFMAAGCVSGFDLRNKSTSKI